MACHTGWLNGTWFEGGLAVVEGPGFDGLLRYMANCYQGREVQVDGEREVREGGDGPEGESDPFCGVPQDGGPAPSTPDVRVGGDPPPSRDEGAQDAAGERPGRAPKMKK